jgi:hypothetical protein
MQFTLVVGDFGVKYVGKEHAQLLKNTLEHHYKLTSQDAKVDLKPLIVAVIPIYLLSLRNNKFVLCLVLCVFNKLIIFSAS